MKSWLEKYSHICTLSKFIFWVVEINMCIPLSLPRYQTGYLWSYQMLSEEKCILYFYVMLHVTLGLHTLYIKEVPKLHTENPQFWSDLRTSLLCEALCSTPINQYTLLYIRKKTKVHHGWKFSCLGHQEVVICALLNCSPVTGTDNAKTTPLHGSHRMYGPSL